MTKNRNSAMGSDGLESKLKVSLEFEIKCKFYSLKIRYEYFRIHNFVFLAK